MKLLDLKAGAIALALALVPSLAFGQASPGTSPLSGSKGGTGNAFMQFTGPATSIKTYALPNASDTIATIAAAQTLTNKTFNCASNTCTVRIGSDVTGLGTGVATFLATPSSANLRAALTDESGTGAAYFQGGDLGTPSAGVLTNATGLPIATGVSGLGTGVATFLATPSSANLASAVTGETGSGALVFATSPALTTPNLGTPSAATLTNATGLPIATGVSGLGTGVATWLATASSANLRSALTDETGSGAAVFGTAPTVGGLFDVAGAIKFSTQTAPAQITANQNDYNPSSVVCASSTTLLINSDAARDITGLAGGVAGCEMRLVNNGSFTITLKEENASSTAGNRFATGGDIALASKAAVTLLYDGAASRWRMASPASAGGGAGSVTSVATSGIITGGTITTSGTIGANATITPQGRLTLASATPVMTSTLSAQTTVYYTPHVGNLVPIYDGTSFVPTAFAEVSQATTDATKSPAAVATGNVYDVFCWSDAGTGRCTRGPAWSSTTSRGTGAGTSELVRVSGLLLNANAITNGPSAQRGTYVGTIYSDASNAISFITGGAASGGTAAMLGLWNAYNRVPAPCQVQDTASSWTYNSTTKRPLNNSTGNRITMVRGLNEDNVEANLAVVVDGAAGLYSQITIGLDATNATAADASSGSIGNVAGMEGSLLSRYSGLPGLGLHYLQAIEFIAGSGTAVYYGGTNHNYMKFSCTARY